MPELKAKIRKLSSFKPAEVNPNRGNKDSVPMIVNSITMNGAGRPMLADKDGEMIAGSHSIQGFIDAGFEEAIVIEGDGTLPVIFQRTDLDINSPQGRSLQVGDNSIAIKSYDPDEPLLAALLANMAEEDAALVKAAGFEEADVRALMERIEQGEAKADPSAQVDKAAQLQERWQVERGDMWQIGKHKLLCGDSTNADDVARLMDGEKADMVFTDPPYNTGSENGIIASDVSAAMQGLKDAEWDRDFDIRPALDRLLEVIAKDVTVYICTSHHLACDIWTWMREWSAHHSWCAWSKTNPMPSLMKRHWTWNGELVAYATRGKHIFNFPDDGHAPSIWHLSKHKETQHPTEKPVEVPEHAIKHSSISDMVILDPFGGSGTTMVACEQLGRQCRMIEISEKYCAVILQRMHDMGLSPERVNGHGSNP